MDKKVDSGLHDEPNLCIDILTQSAREEYKDKTSRQEASNGQRVSEEAAALGGSQIKLGEPNSQLGGPQSQLGGPWSQVGGP